MKIKKIYDANVLIFILEEMNFSEIILLWNQNPRYEQWTTCEVNNEVKKKARSKLDELIKKKILKVFKPVSKIKLKHIQIKYPTLSIPDCSLLYYCKQINNCICLTTDRPLRNYLTRNNIPLAGMVGIYNKLRNDKSFPLNNINKKFYPLFKNKRVFPQDFIENP